MKSLPTLSKSLSEFLLAQEADGSSKATLRWYRSILTAFAGDIGDKTLKQIAAGDIRRYLVDLRQKEFSDATVSAHTRALHKFWAWASQEYGIINPMRNIKYPAKQQPKPRAASLDDLQKMFAGAGIRDRAIIAFMLDTGCRAGGVCTLRTENLDIDEKRAIVTEKGNKTRVVYFTTFTADLLKLWQAERQPATAFFHSDTLEELTPSGLYQAMRRLARRAQVTGRFNPHALRHTFAREYIKSGGDLPTLAKLLGHREIGTTVDHYVLYTNDELREAHEKYSPARKLGKPKG
ncbi:MAG: tyrosine-type recombinase/integrase [Anaerolineae bacterium]|nr:tyrosine-type recombinase/integrase [Anaerolineae bacterium]